MFGDTEDARDALLDCALAASSQEYRRGPACLGEGVVATWFRVSGKLPEMR